ncbi:MAG TPA: ABC transporter ATP-binding protein [Methylomirabilota bacterium]|nr:ABC transporter ATP-binding protein [Methylomirabilota bacterium]
MADPILETSKLCRSFGSLTAVHQVDFAVQPGELRAIIGPNGAGKTTFFRLISGEMAPSSGRIRFKGQDVTGMPQHRVSRLGVSKSYQITNVFPHLTVLENVRVAVQSYRYSFNFWSRASALDGVRARAEAILREVALWDKRALTAAQLSHGEKRHLELGIALATEPSLLLLDEPTAGMSPEETDETIRLIRKIATGRTVILVEHKMKVVMNISDRITVLHQGQVLAEGSPADIRANTLVQQTYLGATK